MSRIWWGLCGAALVAVTAWGCKSKPSKELAVQACRHMMSISFWKGWKKRIEERKVPKEKHAELRKAAAKEWDKMLSAGEGKMHLDNCVKVYLKLTKKQLECVLGAKTTEKVKSCTSE